MAELIEIPQNNEEEKEHSVMDIMNQLFNMTNSEEDVTYPPLYLTLIVTLLTILTILWLLPKR